MLQIYHKLMIRNSIEKYKQIYGKTPIESAFSKTCGTQKQAFSKSHTEYGGSSISKMRNAVASKLETGRGSSIKATAIFKNRAQPKSIELRSEEGNFSKTLRSFRNESKSTEQARHFKTSKDEQFQEEAVSVQTERNARDSKEFIQNMPKNSLFYCTRCFQYVFDIEKKRHYPECKDTFPLKFIETQEYYKLACFKLQKIVELSQYGKIKPKEIQQLFQGIQKGQLQSLDAVDYPKDYEFFSLQEIEQAFVFTYDSLLRGVKKHQKASLLGCF